MKNEKWMTAQRGRMMNRIINIKSIATVLIPIFFLGFEIQAQSVDSLINEALHSNPQMKSLQYKISAAGFRAKSADNLPPPSLGIEFQQIPVTSINLWDQPYSQNLSISQMFPLGGKIDAMTEVEKKNIAIEKNSYEIYMVNLSARVRMSYFTLWQIEKKIELQQKTVSIINDLISSLETGYVINRVNQADLLTLKSEASSNRTQIIVLQNQKEAEIYRLNRLLGRELDSRSVFTLPDVPADSIKKSQAELEDELLRSNPSLNRMSSMIEMNKAMIDANNRELIPDLMLQGMIMRMPQGMPITAKTDPIMIDGAGKTEYMYSLMASITLPFAPWSINKINAKEEELSAGISGIQYEKIDMQREMLSGLKEAYSKYMTALKLVKVYSSDVLSLFSMAADAQVSAYQNGKTGINTVLDSYRMLLMQEMNYYMSKADVEMAIAEIEMMVGKRIDNF